jgi:hypothetical protein
VDCDCDGRTNSTNAEKWAKETLPPNTPEQPVVVSDNVSYHYAQVDKLRSEYTIRAEMISRVRRQKTGLTSAVQDVSIEKDTEKTYRFIQNNITQSNTTVFLFKSCTFRSRYRPSSG